MISKIITPGEFFVTVRAFIVPVKIIFFKYSLSVHVHIPVSTVFCNMPLPIALHSELEATLIADERFDAPGKLKISYYFVRIIGI